MLEFYRKLGNIREDNGLFIDGEFKIEFVSGAVIGYSRYSEDQKITMIVNASHTPFKYDLKHKNDLLSGKTYDGSVDAMSAVILR